MWPWYWIGSFCGYLQPLVYLVLWVFCSERPLCMIYENQWILGTILIMISDLPKNYQIPPKSTNYHQNMSVCLIPLNSPPACWPICLTAHIKINLSKKLTKIYQICLILTIHLVSVWLWSFFNVGQNLF